MHFESFDSLDEMLRVLDARQTAADARVEPWQAALRPGDQFRRGSGYGFPIYGEVLPDEEPREQAQQHYRFCRCYSVVCPDGELGDVHVSMINEQLDAASFEEARLRGWWP